MLPQTLLTLALVLAQAPRAASKRPEPAATPNVNAKPLTLQTVIRSAVLRNPEVLVARAQAEFAAGVRTQRGALFTPRLTFRGTFGTGRTLVAADPGVRNYNQQSFDIGVEGYTPLGTRYELLWANSRVATDQPLAAINPTLVTTPQLSLSQPLLRSFGPTANLALLESSREEAAAAQDNVEATMLQVAVDAADRYWGWAFQLEGVRITTLALSQAQEQLEATQARVRIGALSPLELTQAEATVAQREDELRAQQRNVYGAERELLRVAWLQGEPDFDWLNGYAPGEPPQSSVASMNMQELVDRALQNRPELKRAESLVAAQQRVVSGAEIGLLPRLDLVARVGLSGLAGDPTGFAPIAPYLKTGAGSAFANLGRGPFVELGVEGELPFNFGQERGALQGQRAELSRRRAVAEQARGEISLEVRAIVQQLKADMGRVTATKEAERLSNLNLEAERKKFNAGISTTFDVLRVQGELARARSNAFQALANLNSSLARLDRATGTLLQRYGVPFDAGSQ